MPSRVQISITGQTPDYLTHLFSATSCVTEYSLLPLGLVVKQSYGSSQKLTLEFFAHVSCGLFPAMLPWSMAPLVHHHKFGCFWKVEAFTRVRVNEGLLKLPHNDRITGRRGLFYTKQTVTLFARMDNLIKHTLCRNWTTLPAST